MLCSKCGKREATVYISQTVNGIKTEKRLCRECSELENGYTFGAFSANDLFEGVFGGGFVGQKRSAAKKCPVCGLDSYELAKSGRAGCAECYEVFAPELGKIISGIHGTATHKGASPENCAKNAENMKEIARLKKEQQEAIAEQNYERAAELRDMIRTLQDGKEG